MPDAVPTIDSLMYYNLQWCFNVILPSLYYDIQQFHAGNS